MSAFLSECHNLLGKQHVLTEELASYLNNVGCFKRSLSAVVLPGTSGEVGKVVALSNQYLVKLYPISCGKNWGYGSCLPVKDDTVVVDLRRLNQIREINDDFGYAVIEPGVTQQALSDRLRSMGSRYFVDVTASSASSSVIGNALERGVAHCQLRVESLSAMEVVLGNGQTVRTGYSHFQEKSQVQHLYKYGIGPHLDGLFSQSNYGIVTLATVKLLPLPEFKKTCTLEIKDPKTVPDVANAITRLAEKGIIKGIPQIFNKARSLPGLAAILFQQLSSEDLPRDRMLIEALIQRDLHSEWTASLPLSGTRPQVRYAEKMAKRELKKFGRVMALSDKQYALAKTLTRLSGQKGRYRLLKSMAGMRGLAIGIPSDEFLGGLCWPITADLDNIDLLKPEAGPAGTLYVTPFAPASVEALENLLKLAQETSQRHGFNVAISLNLVASGLVEGVISIAFPKNDPEKVQEAHLWLKELTSALKAAGLFPYRTDIDSMPLIVDPDDTFWQVTKSLKMALDPNNIISPGRYSLL